MSCRDTGHFRTQASGVTGTGRRTYGVSVNREDSPGHKKINCQIVHPKVIRGEVGRREAAIPALCSYNIWTSEHLALKLSQLGTGAGDIPNSGTGTGDIPSSNHREVVDQLLRSRPGRGEVRDTATPLLWGSQRSPVSCLWGGGRNGRDD